MQRNIMAKVIFNPELIEVCNGAMCTKRNSKELLDKLKKEFKDVRSCGCTGNCGKGPNIVIDEKRVLHYSKPRDIVDRVKNDEGEKFNRPSEEEVFDVLSELD